MRPVAAGPGGEGVELPLPRPTRGVRRLLRVVPVHRADLRGDQPLQVQLVLFDELEFRSAHFSS